MNIPPKMFVGRVCVEDQIAKQMARRHIFQMDHITLFAKAIMYCVVVRCQVHALQRGIAPSAAHDLWQTRHFVEF